MDTKRYKAAVEAVLFAHGEPISAARLAQALEKDLESVEKILLSLQSDLDHTERGLQLLCLDGGWQLATKNEYGSLVKKAMDTRRNTPLSQAALEVLAVIAYNQPVSRGFVEQVRGVDSSSTVATLLEKGLVEEAGRLDLPGHPISFRTTDTFLRTFGIQGLAGLPPLHDLPLEQYAQQNEQV